MELSKSLQAKLNTLANEQGCSVESLIEGWISAETSSKTIVDQQLQEQRVNLARYQGIVDSQVDLVCRYTPDTILTFVNDAYCHHFGLRREEILGKKFIDIIRESQKPEIWSRIAEVLESPEPDVRILRSVLPNGDENWIQWMDHGITDESGKVIEIQAVGRDITDLIFTQRELERQREVLQKIFDHIPVLIALFGQDLKVEIVNQSWVDTLGWTAEDMNAHPDILSAFYPDPDYRQAAIEYMAQAKAGWRDWQTVAKDGRVIEIAWANVQLSDGRRIGIGQEISGRIELEKQARYAQMLEIELQKERELIAMRGRIISTISHEFRTPLAVIQVSIDLIQRYLTVLPPERLEAKFKDIRYQIKHLVNLLEDVVSLDQTSARKIEVNPTQFNVAHFARRLIDNMRLVHNESHHFILDIPEIGQINADQHLLEHVFSNLISNAVKYSSAGSQIMMRGQQIDGAWQFEIEDEGIGIPEDDLMHLFEPFHRAQNVGSIDGSGLGLAIVQDYVELHNGTINVISEVNKGTTFQILIPKAIRTPSISDAPASV